MVRIRFPPPGSLQRAIIRQAAEPSHPSLDVFVELGRRRSVPRNEAGKGTHRGQMSTGKSEKGLGNMAGAVFVLVYCLRRSRRFGLNQYFRFLRVPAPLSKFSLLFYDSR